MAGLTEEQQAQLDMTNYNAAIDAAAGYTNPEFDDATTWEGTTYNGTVIDVLDGNTTGAELYAAFAATMGEPTAGGISTGYNKAFRFGSTTVYDNSTAITGLSDSSISVEKTTGRTWVTGTSWSSATTFTIRVYHNVTASLAADSDANATGGSVSVANNGKVYYNTAATITVAAVDGYKAEVYNAAGSLVATLNADSGWSYQPTITETTSYTVKYVSETATEYNVSVVYNENGDWGTASLGNNKGIAGAEYLETSVEVTVPVQLNNKASTIAVVADETVGGVVITDVNGEEVNKDSVSAGEVTITVNVAVDYYYVKSVVVTDKNGDIVSAKNPINAGDSYSAKYDLTDDNAYTVTVTYEEETFTLPEGPFGIQINGFDNETKAVDLKKLVLDEIFGEGNYNANDYKVEMLTKIDVVVWESENYFDVTGFELDLGWLGTYEIPASLFVTQLIVDGVTGNDFKITKLGSSNLCGDDLSVEKVFITASESRSAADIQLNKTEYAVDQYSELEAQIKAAVVYKKDGNWVDITDSHVTVSAIEEKEGKQTVTITVTTHSADYLVNEIGISPEITVTLNEYNVTRIVDDERTSEPYHYGDAIEKPEDPAAPTGHSFSGWDANGDGAADEVASQMGNSNLTYTALWTVNNYIVTWTVNGVEYAKTEVAYGTATYIESASCD